MKISKLSLATSILLGLVLSQQVLADVSGTAYLEFPVNGFNTQATYGEQDGDEQGLAGITVTVTDVNGVASTHTTGVNGSWTDPTTSFPVRVVFTWPNHSWLESSPVSAGSNSSVQFVTADSTSVNFGLHDPDEYFNLSPEGSPPLPLLFSPEPKFGPAVGVDNDNATQGGTASINYDEGGNAWPAINMRVPFGDIGATYGVAHRKADNALFVSSFQKAFSGFGPNGVGGTTTGGIYLVDNSQGSAPATLFADLGALTGTDEHPQPGDDCSAAAALDSGRGGYLDCWLYDDSGVTTGKISLGDLEMSPDESQLFTVNLNTRKIVSIGLSTPVVGGDPIVGAITEHDLSAYLTDCKSNEAIDWRPFALGKHNDKMYLGVTCTAEKDFSDAVTAGTVTDYDTAIVDDAHDQLEAIIYEFNPATPSSITEVTRFDLNYDRNGLLEKNNPSLRTSHWHPWTFNGTWQVDSFFGGYTMYATPMVSDIDFAFDPSDQLFDLVVGIRDRTGDQYGWHTGNPHNKADSRTLLTVAGGEEIRLCNDGSGGYVLESAGKCNDGSIGGAGTTTDHGPNGGEYYSDDFTSAHSEIFFGSSFYVNGSGRLSVTGQDVVTTGSSAGFGAWRDSDGLKDWSSNIYGQTAQTLLVPLFGKANGLGDIEALTAPAPLEIGNRVWDDTNGNGMQDAGEAGIEGVVVTLNCGGSDFTQTTANGGQYLFTDSNVAGGIPRNTACTITVPDTNAGKGITIQTSTTDEPLGSNPDATGSFTLRTGFAGQNNHTYDIGYSNVPPVVGCTTIINNVSISAVDQTDTDATNDTASASVDANCTTPEADLELVKTADKSTVFKGDTLIYTLTLTNKGASDATDVEVTDALPANVTFVSATAPAGTSFDDTTKVWTIPSLPAASGSNVLALKIEVTIN